MIANAANDPIGNEQSNQTAIVNRAKESDAVPVDLRDVVIAGLELVVGQVDPVRECVVPVDVGRSEMAIETKAIEDAKKLIANVRKEAVRLIVMEVVTKQIEITGLAEKAAVTQIMIEADAKNSSAK